MSIWISKSINIKRYKHAIIDGFAAIKTAFGDNFDKRNFFVMEAYESVLSSMTEDGGSRARLRVTPHILTGAGTNSCRIPSVEYPRYLEIKRPGSLLEECLIDIYIDEILEDYDEYNTLRIESYMKEKTPYFIDDRYVSWDYLRQATL